MSQHLMKICFLAVQSLILAFSIWPRLKPTTMMNWKTNARACNHLDMESQRESEKEYESSTILVHALFLFMQIHQATTL